MTGGFLLRELIITPELIKSTLIHPVICSLFPYDSCVQMFINSFKCYHPCLYHLITSEYNNQPYIIAHDQEAFN